MHFTSWSCWLRIVSTTIAVFPLQRPRVLRVDRPLAVERVPERIDDAAEQRLAHGHAGDATGSTHRLALADVLPLAEERHTDVVLLEVERNPDDVVLELEHLRRDGVLEPVDAGNAVADLEHRADFREVGLDVVLLDPRLEDRRDLFGAKLQVVSYLAVISSRRSRSSRPRTLASTRIEPAWRTMPPISAGSAVRVASTGRPEACSIWPMICRASSSDRSYAVVSSTVSRRSCCAIRRSNSRWNSRICPPRFFSTAIKTKLRTSSSAPPRTSSSACALARGSICGFRSSASSSGTSSIAAVKSASSSRTCASRPFSSAAWKRARAYVRCATDIRPGSSPRAR